MSKPIDVSPGRIRRIWEMTLPELPWLGLLLLGMLLIQVTLHLTLSSSLNLVQATTAAKAMGTDWIRDYIEASMIATDATWVLWWVAMGCLASGGAGFLYRRCRPSQKAPARR